MQFTQIVQDGSSLRTLLAYVAFSISKLRRFLPTSFLSSKDGRP